MPRQTKHGDILVSLTNGQELRTGIRRCNLRIEDEMTGRIVVDVDFTGEQLAAMLGGHVTRLEGAHLAEGS
jgi:hypothetical protein